MDAVQTMQRSEHASTQRSAPPVSRALRIAELERMWRLDSLSPAEPRPSQTRIVVRRNSPHDAKNDQVLVLIDEHPLAALRYGEVSVQAVEPGRHSVCVSNSWFARTLVVEVEHARPLYLQCGTGLRGRKWLARLLSRLGDVNLWLVLDPEG